MDHAEGGGKGVPEVVGIEGHQFEDGEGTGGGGPRDGFGFRIGIGSRVGSIGRGRGGAGGGRGGEKHIQWGERIKWSVMERRECRPLLMISHTRVLLRKLQNSEIIY